MDEMTQEMKDALKALEQTAHKIAQDLPQDKREKIYSKMTSQEFENFVNKIHYTNGLLGVTAESIRLGSTIGEVSYEIHLTTKQHESEEDAVAYMQQRKSELVTE